MFFEEGWTPLSEVTREVFHRLQRIRAAEPPGEAQTRGMMADLAISVWDICDAATKIGVTGQDGQVIPASKDLVAWADPTSLSNEHICLTSGNVGSSTLTGPEGALDEAALRARYGAFLHLPVVMPVNNFQSSLTFLEDELAEQKQKDEALIEAARAIVRRVEEGGLLSRELARREIGAKLSRRKFKLAWALAARHKPELREPRRWAGL